MEIISVGGCPYEDNEGEILSLKVKLSKGESFSKGDFIKIELMDDSFIEREIKIINPKVAGDYASLSHKASAYKKSETETLEIAGECHCTFVVTDVEYHDVKTDEEISSREFDRELEKMVCITPYKEIIGGDKSIYDYLDSTYTVPDKVIEYLRTTKPCMMFLGIYDHPFHSEKRLLGPYTYKDDYYYWDRDTWKYVIKYGLKLPDEFIEHVMSDDGSKFLEEFKKETPSWGDEIKKIKEQPNTLCLLPDDAGDEDLEDF